MIKEKLNLVLLDLIKNRASKIHESVNQLYDNLPYSFHLTMVSEFMLDYIDYFNLEEDKIYTLYFASCFHDTIEDARLTYGSVKNIAKEFLSEENSLLAADIVYALTNEKGKTRAERANSKYYEGIRTTPYAPFIKVCDRLANTVYSIKISKEINMAKVYKKELNHFIDSLTIGVTGLEYTIPEKLLEFLIQTTNL